MCPGIAGGNVSGVELVYVCHVGKVCSWCTYANSDELLSKPEAFGVSAPKVADVSMLRRGDFESGDVGVSMLKSGEVALWSASTLSRICCHSSSVASDVCCSCVASV